MVFVYRNDKRLRNYYQSGRWYARIYKKSGKLVTVDTERLAELIFSDENPPELTRAMIEDRMKARQVPEYPRYSVTEYGAIYCMVPPKRGPNAGKMYLLREKTKCIRQTIRNPVRLRRMPSLCTSSTYSGLCMVIPDS